MKGDELYVPRSGKEKPGEENNILDGSHTAKTSAEQDQKRPKPFQRQESQPSNQLCPGRKKRGGAVFVD